MSSLQDGDYTDPTGDRLILEDFKRLDMVPADADGNSAQHWGTGATPRLETSSTVDSRAIQKFTVD